MNENKNEFAHKVDSKAKLKIKAKRSSSKGVWNGLGMMGLVGWSVVLPTLIGAALGKWLDEIYSKEFSWTLSLLIIGLCVGCINAWFWILKEDMAMQENDQDE